MSTTKTSSTTKMPAKSSKTTATPAPVAVAAPAPEATPAKRRRQDAPAAVVAAPAVTVAASTETSTVETPSVSYEDVIKQLETLRSGVSAAIASVRDLQKAGRRAVREAQAAGKKRRKERDPNAPPKKPSGITKPVEVSAELLKFMSRPAGTLVSRTEAATFVLGYARQNGLFDQVQRKKINANAALVSLLRLSDGDVLTIPSLQKFIGVHFPKKAVPAATA